MNALNYVRNQVASRIIENQVSSALSSASNLTNSTTQPRNERASQEICSMCQSSFSLLNRMVQCDLCEKVFCSKCYGYNAWFKCVYDRGCMACQDAARRRHRFQTEALPVLSAGVSCTYVRKQTFGSYKRLPVWLSFDSQSTQFKWRTMEMRSNQPVDQGTLSVHHIEKVDDTFVTPNTMVLKGSKLPSSEMIFEFADIRDFKRWIVAIDEACEFLTQQGHSEELQSLHKQRHADELQARAADREERKKQLLASGVGMKYTAQALMMQQPK